MVKKKLFMKNTPIILILLGSVIFTSCGKKDSTDTPVTPIPPQIAVQGITVNTTAFTNTLYGINRQPVITITLNEPVMQSSVASAVKLVEAGIGNVAVNITYQKG